MKDNQNLIKHMQRQGTQLAVKYGEQLTLQSDTVILDNQPSSLVSVQLPVIPATIGNAAYKNTSPLTPELAGDTYSPKGSLITRYVINEMTPYFYNTTLDFTPTAALSEKNLKYQLVKNAELLDIKIMLPERNDTGLGKVTIQLNKNNGKWQVHTESIDFGTGKPIRVTPLDSINGIKDSFNHLEMDVIQNAQTIAVAGSPLTDEHFYEMYRGAKQLASIMRSTDVNYMTINSFTVDTYNWDDETLEFGVYIEGEDIYIALIRRITTEDHESAVIPAAFVSNENLDAAALAILFLERAYSLHNERAATLMSHMLMIKAKIPDLMVKWPFLENQLSQFLRAMTSKKFTDTFTSGMSTLSDTYARNTNTLNYRLKYSEPFTKSMGSAYNVEIPSVHEEGFSFYYDRQIADTSEAHERLVQYEDFDYNWTAQLYLWAKAQQENSTDDYSTYSSAQRLIGNWMSNITKTFKNIKETEWYTAISELIDYNIQRGMPSGLAKTEIVQSWSGLSNLEMFKVLKQLTAMDVDTNQGIFSYTNFISTRKNDINGNVDFTLWVTESLTMPAVAVNEAFALLIAGPVQQIDFLLQSDQDIVFELFTNGKDKTTTYTVTNRYLTVFYPEITDELAASHPLPSWRISRSKKYPSRNYMYSKHNSDRFLADFPDVNVEVYKSDLTTTGVLVSSTDYTNNYYEENITWVHFDQILRNYYRQDSILPVL